MFSKLRPTNEAAEKRRFFAAVRRGKVYNPLFQYSDEAFCQEVIAAFDTVFYTNAYAEMAEKILDAVIAKYGDGAQYKALVWGRQISPKHSLNRAREYIQEHNLSAKAVMGDTMVTTMGNKTLNLVPTPGYYRDIRLESLLDHELSVHYIRRVNHRNLESNIRKSLRGQRAQWVSSQLSTEHTVQPNISRLLEKQSLTMDEEGLASLVTHAWYTNCYLLFQPALCNYIVHQARRLSFHDLYQLIVKKGYCVDEDDAWTQVMRAKRGCRDTSIPGAFCKDILYFIGSCCCIYKLLFSVLLPVEMSRYCSRFPNLQGP